MNKELISKETFELLNSSQIFQNAYSSGIYNNAQLTVSYISDIHLLHHLTPTNYEKQIQRIVKNLFKEEQIYKSDILLFCGDTASNNQIVKMFYHEVKIRYIYNEYKNWKKTYQTPLTKKELELKYNNYIKELELKYNKEKLYLSNWFKYTRRHKSMTTSRLIELMSKKGFPNYIKYHIHLLKKIENDLVQFVENPSYKNGYFYNYNSISHFNKPKFPPIFVVLGNHELIDYKTVDEAVKDYQEFFKRESITFLHNNGGTFNIKNRKVSIIGGIGFAKYNESFNANNTVTTTPKMSRKQEIEESNKFYDFYCKILNKCKKNDEQLIVVSHYPVNDWLKNKQTHPICTYFTGHSHRNDSEHTLSTQIYADNQIGYKRKNIEFKTCKLGMIYNPFVEFEDGYYEINTTQYTQFMLFCNEKIIGTKLIEKQLNTGLSKFYLIKRNNFHGFFIVNQKTGTKICAGGMLKNISKNTDIKYFYDYFVSMVDAYYKLLYPYRAFQEQISNEITKLGLSGKIHGCIIDIDFYYHIMINPFDGKITYYYSPWFGTIQTFENFHLLLEDRKERLLLEDSISKGSRNIIVNSNVNTDISNLIKIVIKDSVYTASRQIYNIQRIFTSNVLRDWNENLLNNVNNLTIFENQTKQLPEHTEL